MIGARGWQWRRGARALVAIGAVVAVCWWLGRPVQAAALGAFNVLLIDNGGPYRPRLATMANGAGWGWAGAGAGMPGAGRAVAGAVLATLAVCFVVTYARVLSQPVASASVLILVLYFAGLGGTTHTLNGGLAATWTMVLLGGAWAGLLSLVLWPLDAFRPARMAVAGCYESLAEFTGGASRGQGVPAEAAVYEWQRQAAGAHRGGTDGAFGDRRRGRRRGTIRARNLTVLLETSDMLLARTMRLTEQSSRGVEVAGLRALAGRRRSARWAGRLSTGRRMRGSRLRRGARIRWSCCAGQRLCRRSSGMR